ncbi:pickpocket protein 28-like [Uranotaenia lowii]|uniref:pickpocket protein 28-like n=1 Tax=Uranotaenia lowii TaxID=190385 RepID=UPI002479F630|nr:pickpocket protein 28-like [Uranotaenia lowii]
MLHNPQEYPQTSKDFIRIDQTETVSIAVQPAIIKTAPTLLRFGPSIRHCYFKRERKLKFFKIYSPANCELECLTNYTLKVCGCVKYSMPRSAEDRICQTWELKCIMMAQFGNSNTASDCNCLPACQSVQYDFELSKTTHNHQATNAMRYKQFRNADSSLKKPIYQYVSVAIYFKADQIIPIQRTELYGLLDVIADCGGFLGLCLGVSLLSLVELFYFCAIRPFRNRYSIDQ